MTTMTTMTASTTSRMWARGFLLLLLSVAAVTSISMDGTFVVEEQEEAGETTELPPPPPPSPLRLTPLLEAGNVTGARALAAVPDMLPSCCTSYSGFLTVDKKYDSNLFFWFFPSETRRNKAPLVLWLQGGPGTSMMRTVFLENGPYRIDPRTRRLQRRRGAWTRAHSMLYVDNPVGTGYSFTRDPKGLAKNVKQVSRSLIEALRQFFIMFPEQRGRDLYIAGESFGGKMATALAYAIHRMPTAGPAPGASLRATAGAPGAGRVARASGFHLKGLLVVNGLIEATSQMDKSEIAYQLGLVDEEGRDEMRALAAEQGRLVLEGRWPEAMKLSRDECGGNISPVETGLVGLTNYLLWNGTQDDGFQDLAQHEHVRTALHVGNATFTGRASAVSRAISEDVAVSALPQLAEVADNYRVLVANGQMDLCLPYRLTANYLRKMQWSGADQLATSKRTTWCVRGQLAGYARTAAGLTHVLVRNAGHYLGQDQPRWAADMLQRFTDKETFDNCEERCPNATRQ